MPHYGQGVPYKPSKNHDDRKPINKNADCLQCMSGHSLFKREKKEKKKQLKDKDLFIMKGEKKSNNININKSKKRTNGKNITSNKYNHRSTTMYVSLLTSIYVNCFYSPHTITIFGL